MIAVAFWLAVWLLLPGLVPGVANASRPPAAPPAPIEIRTRAGSLGSIPLVVTDPGQAHVSAERLAVVLGGAWIVRGDRGSLAVGGRAAHFTRDAASVVVQGQVIRLSSTPRVGASGWLLPGDFVTAALGRLVPGATALRVEPAPVQPVAARPPPSRAPAAAPAPAAPVPAAKPAAVAPRTPEPPVAPAAPPGTPLEIRAGARALGSVEVGGADSGQGYVSAQRLAVVLGGAWIARGDRGSLAVGGRAAHFTRDAASVVVQGQVIRLSSTPRVDPSGWLLPADFLATAIGRLVPGVTAARVEPVALPATASLKPPARAPAAPARAAPEARPPARSGGSPVALTELRHRSYPGYTRVVVETGAPLPQLVEPGGREVRARLPGLSLSGPRAEDVGDGLVKEIRLEPAGADGLLRIALEAAAAEVQTLSLEDPHRLVIDIHRRPEAGEVVIRSEPDRGLRLIVIDPGHGGHDPGAIGPTGLAEKDVVLDVSRRVASLVEEALGVKVAMTRSTDVFVPLRERTNFANRQRADLFVSIHANAHPRSLSQGVETYFLSSEATDNEARQVAAIENGVLQLETPAQRRSSGALKNILWDLAQSDFLQESSAMAETVQDRMTGSLGLVNRGVKQAGFYVLGGAAMPAILIEVGFLTNPREERKLASPAHRQAVAQAIYAGLAEYKARHDQRMRAARTPSSRSQTR